MYRQLMRRLQYTDRDQLPVWLEDEEINQPETVLKDFFSVYELPQCRYYLWELLNAAMQGCNGDFPTGFPAHTMLHFYEKLNCLIEAASLVYRDAPEK